MSGIKICGVGKSVPEKIVTNDDMAKIVDTNDEWIYPRTGIKKRHYCEGESQSELCINAAKEAIKRADISPRDIGVCLVATMTADTIIPSCACLLQKELGLEEDTVCFDLNAACSGFVYAMHTAECLLKSCHKRYGLVIGGEVMSRILNFEDRTTCILFGDGAGVAVVELDEDLDSINAVLGARGDKDILHVHGVGTNERCFLSMEGTKVFKFAVEAVSDCIDKVLLKSKRAIEDVDYFVFHQANARIIDLVVKKYGIPQERYYRNIEEYANTSAASVPLVLCELAEKELVKKGSKVLMVGFGGGLTWGGALVEFA